MKLKLLCLLGCMLSVCVMAQTEPSAYRQPFDFPVLFAGNFGEIRANHFHGGLDFKTQGAVGKPVHAQADGYISRIRVNTGSGYVLNVTYDNGYYLIYRHLNKFVGEVAERVEEQQYVSQQWEVDIIPAPNEYPVKRGQVLAYSGNTGYSTGPHLHLDMIELETDEFVDPLPFFKAGAIDRVAPKAEGFMIFPQMGLGVVDGRQSPASYPVTPQKTITAWGVIGLAVKAYDHMEGAANRYGVKHLSLSVDGNEVFRSDVERFAESEHLYINSWTEGQYMKSFIEPGNKLRMLKALNDNRGLVDITEERPYHFIYTLSDDFGNTSKAELVVVGKRQTIPQIDTDARQIFRWDKLNVLQQPGMELVVPKGCLYDDAYLDLSVTGGEANVSYTYKLSAKEIPMHQYAEIKIGLLNRPVEDCGKYFVARVGRNGNQTSVGGTYEDGFMKARVRSLATYTVSVDTIAPKIQPINQAKWGRSGRVSLKLNEKGSGVQKFSGTIDGQYALFGVYNSYHNLIECILDPKHVQKGKKHLLVFTAVDACGNECTESYSFVW